jgi:hypothetical protein
MSMLDSTRAATHSTVLALRARTVCALVAALALAQHLHNIVEYLDSELVVTCLCLARKHAFTYMLRWSEFLYRLAHDKE